jgi:hypothetical protein
VVKASDQSGNPSFNLSNGLGCATDVMVPQDAICLRLVHAFKDSVKSAISNSINNVEGWKISEEEYLSFVLDSNSNYYGMVQFRRRLTNSCSDNTKMVQLYSYFSTTN